MGVSAVPGPSAELGQGSKEHSNLRTTVTFQLSGQAQDVPEMELELELPLIVEVPFSSWRCHRNVRVSVAHIEGKPL